MAITEEILNGKFNFCAVQAVTKRLKQNPMQAESNPNIIFCYFQPEN